MSLNSQPPSLVVIKLRLPSCGSQARVSKCGYAAHAGSAEQGDLDTALEAEFDRKLRRARDRVRRGIRSAPFRPWGLLKAIANGQAGEIEGCQIWLRFATWILLALEFAPAADIFARPHLGRYLQARGHHHHPHHAELFPGQGHFRLRPVQQSGAKGRKLESWAESGRLINWTQVRICGSVH